MATAHETPGILRCWVRYGASSTIVRVRGEVDLSSSELLRRCITRALTRSPGVIVDMVNVTHLDGTGIRVLEEMSARAVAVSRPFWIVPSRQVLRLLTTLRITELPTADSLEEAIERLTPPD
ncbi:MAG: STAS domain-containing protein [bacterium]